MDIVIKKSGMTLKDFRNSYGYLIDMQSELEEFGDIIRSIVLDRTERGEFIGGVWKDELYSVNIIKAFKLGNVEIVGQGKDTDMFIDGIFIDRGDWGWGRYTKDGYFFTKKDNQKHPHPEMVYLDTPQSPFDGTQKSRPSPIFIPGYQGWRVKYKGLSNVRPNLSYTGQMLESFDVDVSRMKGSNQYSTKARIEFYIDSHFESLKDMTNYYRRWFDITEDELQQAIELSGLPIQLK